MRPCAAQGRKYRAGRLTQRRKYLKCVFFLNYNEIYFWICNGWSEEIILHSFWLCYFIFEIFSRFIGYCLIIWIGRTLKIRKWKIEKKRIMKLHCSSVSHHNTQLNEQVTFTWTKKALNWLVNAKLAIGYCFPEEGIEGVMIGMTISSARHLVGNSIFHFPF